MSITGLEDISFSKEEVKENREGSINTTRTLIFKHQASVGELVIDTTALVTPSEAAANGFTQPSLAEVAELQLLVNKKNLKIHSSRGVWLQMYEDFLVTGQNTIQLIGNIADLGGALEGEVFTIYASPIQANTIVTTDAKRQYQEYLLADGQSVLNLGREFEIRNVPTSQVGSIRVFRNGVGPLLRNVGNAAADPLADGNYQEIDSGNGIGTTIEFNTPAMGQDDVIVVEFGLEYAGDLSMVGDIESLYGAVLKLADDVKDLGPYPITRYLTANPSEVERRGFGNLVFLLQRQILELAKYDNYRVRTGNGFGSPGIAIRRFQNIVKNVQGNFVTIVDSATDGYSITVVKRCKLFVTYSDRVTGATAPYIGLSLNASSLSGALTGLPAGQVLVAQAMPGPAVSNAPGTVSYANIFEPGDIIRPHVDGVVASFDSTSEFAELAVLALPVDLP